MCLWLLMRWGRIESQLLLRGEACGCCCGDGSTANDDGSTADGMMRWLRSDGYASNKAAGCEDSGCYWCCVGDSSSHVAMSHGSSLVISCEENHGRLETLVV